MPTLPRLTILLVSHNLQQPTHTEYDCHSFPLAKLVISYLPIQEIRGLQMYDENASKYSALTCGACQTQDLCSASLHLHLHIWSNTLHFSKLQAQRKLRAGYL